MSTKNLDKILSIILIITITAALAMVIYVIVTPKRGEEFTEFYILGSGGKAADYPTNLAIGEKGEVIVGVVNHEYEDVSYLFRAEIENRSIGEKRLQLVHNETYRDLHLWLDIKAL